MALADSLIDTLRQRGYRITPQRALIIEIFAHHGRHMTADEIFAVVQIRSRAINIATIYRTLDFLVKEGLADRTDLGGSPVVYASRNHGPHIHLVCRQCGECTEVASHLLDSLRDYLHQQHGFAVDAHHLSLVGLCRACREQADG